MRLPSHPRRSTRSDDIREETREPEAAAEKIVSESADNSYPVRHLCPDPRHFLSLCLFLNRFRRHSRDLLLALRWCLCQHPFRQRLLAVLGLWALALAQEVLALTRGPASEARQEPAVLR